MQDLLVARLRRVFESQSSKIAVVIDGQIITFPELQRRSALFAKWLIDHEQSQNVVLLCTNSLGDVVAHVGALQAGKRLLLLDSQEPETRVTRILQERGLSRVYTEDSNFSLRDCDSVLIRTCISNSELDDWYGWDQNEVAWEYFTSGSTGEPKGVQVPYKRRVPNSFMDGAVKPGNVVVATRPFSFLAGGTSMLMTLACGAELHPVDLSTQPLRQTLELFRIKNVEFLTLPPTYLRGLEGFDDLVPIDTCREISLTGERSTSSDLKKLRKIFVNAVLHNSYGSTELGTIARYRIQPSEPIPADPVPVGLPFDCVVNIIGENGEVCDDGVVGEVSVISPRRSPSYSVNGANSPLKEIEIGPHQVAVLTGDAGFINEKGILTILGRVDDIAKIDGKLVNTAAVQSTLLSHHEIADAEVLPVLDRHARSKLRAVVVVRDSSKIDSFQLRKFLLNQLPGWMVPHQFHFVGEIPRNARGKTDRIELLKLVSQLPRAQFQRASMGDPVIWKLTADLFELVDLGGIDTDSDLSNCGLDSLGAIEFVERVEANFGIQIPISTFASKWTLNTIRQQIIEGPAESRKRVVRATSGEKSLELFWLMPGTNLVVGMPLIGYLKEFTSSILIARGAECQEAPFLSIDSVVRDLIEQLVRHLSERDFVLIGFSSAAWIAQHMAVELEARGLPPVRLILMDPPLGEFFDSPFAPPDPYLLMKAREGLLLSSRAHEADVDLLSLQIFGLKNHVPRVWHGKTLVFSTNSSLSAAEKVRELLPNGRSVILQEGHLELMRNPFICGPTIYNFLA